MKKSLVLGLMGALVLTGCSAGNTSAGNAATPTQTVSESPSEVESSSEVESVTSEPLTLEVLDSEGKAHTQTFTEVPKRVITNNQSSLELLLELGLQDSIIGTITLDDPLPEHLEAAFSNIQVITDSKTDPAKEVIAGMNPDLVIGRAATFKDERYGTVTTLNEMGINVYTQLASQMKGEQSLDNIIQDVRNVGEIFNVEEKANTFADELQTRVDAVKEKIEGVNKEPLKVMLMTAYKEGTYNVFGANATFQNEILEAIGGVNINEKGGAQSLENLLDLNPDVIIYIYNNANSETDQLAVDAIYNNELIQEVSAVANQKVIQVPYTEIMGYGHRVVDCIEKLAADLYPELFN